MQSAKADAQYRYKQYTVTIEGLSVHFIHETSPSEEAIPLLLLHGWPGQCLLLREFIIV